MNTGIPYELIIQQIFQEILAQDIVRTVEVKHNVTLQGKTLSHQIDVYWQFEVGGIRYTTVVQAKDWNTAVDQGELLKFRAVLDDLPGQPRGIVVTRTGYQRGAIEYARANDILLYEVDQVPDPPSPHVELTDVGYATMHCLGRTEDQRLVLEITTFTPEFTSGIFHIDTTWLEDIEARFGDEVAQEVLSTRVYGVPREIPLYDAEGNQTRTMRDVYATIVEETRNQGLLRRNATTMFQQPTFLRSSSHEVPFVKITAISTTIDIRQTVRRSLGLPNFVEFTLKNLGDGTVKRIRRPRATFKRPDAQPRVAADAEEQRC